jgi:hypothetical protein
LPLKYSEEAYETLLQSIEAYLASRSGYEILYIFIL